MSGFLPKETRIVAQAVDAGDKMYALRCPRCGDLTDVHECAGGHTDEWFLFMWRNVLHFHTGGVAFAIARNRTEAISLVKTRIWHQFWHQYGNDIESWVQEIENKMPDRLPLDKPFGSFLAGGA